MTTVCTPKEFPNVFRMGEMGRIGRLNAAVVRAAGIGVRVIRSVVPVNTGELRRETTLLVHGTGNGSGVIAQIVEDTPYAAAQEGGTRPFTPPFAAILAWAARQAPNLGVRDDKKTRRAYERAVKTAIRANVRNERKYFRLSVSKRLGQKNANWLQGAALHLGGSRDAVAKAARAQIANDPIYQLARRVWAGIRKNGIKAKWFTRNAQPKLRSILGQCLRAAVRLENGSGEGRTSVH